MLWFWMIISTLMALQVDKKWKNHPFFEFLWTLTLKQFFFVSHVHVSCNKKEPLLVSWTYFMYVDYFQYEFHPW